MATSKTTRKAPQKAKKTAASKVRKAATRKAPAPAKRAARGSHLRVIVSSGKLTQDQQALAARGATEGFGDDDAVDTSMVITDWAELRAAMVTAMGDYANEAKGPTQIEDFKRRKAGTGHVFYVHPLDIEILEGVKRINTRDFTDARMIRRVREMADSVAARGVRQALEVFIQGDKLLLTAGETRLRSTAMAWVLHAAGLIMDAPPKVLPIMLEKPNTNDMDRILGVGISNDTFSMTEIEHAMLWQHALDLGTAAMIGKDEAEARRACIAEIARKVSRSAPFVTRALESLAMPQAVLNIVRTQNVTIAFARGLWLSLNKDTDKTVAALSEAVKTAQALGAARPAQKHLAPSVKLAAATKIGTGNRGGTTSARQPTAAQARKEDGQIDALKAVIEKRSADRDQFAELLSYFVPTSNGEGGFVYKGACNDLKLLQEVYQKLGMALSTSLASGNQAELEADADAEAGAPDTQTETAAAA